MILSNKNKNSAPRKNPIVGTSHDGNLVNPISFCISTYWMEGANKDQKLAAIITPPVNPSEISNTFLFEELKKKTKPDPIAVIIQVKIPARSA